LTKEPDDGGDGVTVAEVYAGGAADRAGLKPGDRLLTIDGRWTDSVADGFAAAETVQAGRAVEVSVRRGGALVRLRVTPSAGI
jgi:S1-C subfamily serine protease